MRLLLIPLFLFAFNLDKEIKKLEKLPPQERYKLMNKIKLEIMKLNEKERIKILKKLLKNAPNLEEDVIQENIQGERWKR